MGLRNLYRAFRETRDAARQQATLAVTGDSPGTADLAARLGAQRGDQGAEIILDASGETLALSGKGVREPGEIRLSSTGENAVVGAIPIPGADMPVMTANQARMVLNIAAAHDEELSLDRAGELLGVLAAGFGLRALARQAVKLVPVGGWAAAAVIGYAGTVAMGRATVLYFEGGKQKLEEREISEIKHPANEEAKEFVSRLRRGR